MEDALEQNRIQRAQKNRMPYGKKESITFN